MEMAMEEMDGHVTIERERVSRKLRKILKIVERIEKKRLILRFIAKVPL